jgi:hypothetical protein
MENKIIFDYDRPSGILFVEDHWDVRTRQDVDDLIAEYDRYLSSITDKVWIVAHIDGLVVSGEIADYYGERARKVAIAQVLGLARWGTDSVARMTLRTTAMKAKMSPVIYSTRMEAIQAIEKMKAEHAAQK